jgi:hypothetical protein
VCKGYTETAGLKGNAHNILGGSRTAMLPEQRRVHLLVIYNIILQEGVAFPEISV